MRRLRHPALPLALLFVAQACTSVIVVGDRDDAAAVTSDQPVTLGDVTADREPPTDRGDAGGPITEPGCRDMDGDRYGFGIGCINVDCDDTNATITDQCYCDRIPNVRQGCLCQVGDAPLGCDLDTGLSRGAEATCNLGQRNCEAAPGSTDVGLWSECRRWRPNFAGATPFVGVVSQCPGSCSTQCRHQVVCPEAGDVTPTGSSNVVAANVAHAVFCPGGAGIRGGVTSTCTPTGCNTGTYRRVFEGASCNGIDEPLWGQFNYTSVVPSGARIGFRVRLSETAAGLATAPRVTLPDAPNGTPNLPTSVDLGALIRVGTLTAPGADHFRFMELEATLVPSTDGLAPTLVSTEVQFTCDTPKILVCRPGGACTFAGDPCRRGRVACITSDGGPSVETCADDGAQPAGTACGAGSVCNAAGACVPCVEGAACDTGQACRAGQLSCATGTPVCVGASPRPAGTVCRPSAGVCDPAETCNGTAAECPPDVFTAAGTVCRASAGVCDIAETCTGATAACPSDNRVASGTVCRPSTGVCDVQETCTGVGAACPANAFLPASTLCAAGTSTCTARSCTGSTAACPAGTGGGAETCDGIDNDCDGLVDEGVTMACYTGPTGTAGVGVCRAGTQSCAAGVWGSCGGQVIPTPEVCDALDNDCNGSLNNGITCP